MTKLTFKPTHTFSRRPDGINVEQLAQDVLKAKNLEQLKKCLYITTRQIESLQKPADRSVDPAAFFVYTPADEPVGAVPMAADAGGKSAEAQTDSLSQALVRTLIWVCNYFLITQINRHIKASHDRHQLEYLLLVLGVLTFASSAIETLNGRFMLLAFLVAVNLAVYLSTKQAFGPDA